MKPDHLVSFLTIGSFMKLGFAYNVVPFKLDYVGKGDITINTTVIYDLEDFHGTQILEEFTKILKYYLNNVVNYLQRKNNV